jgi:hypothetical protein
MRSGAFLAAMMIAGTFATTLEVAAQHRDHHSNNGVARGAQGNEPTTTQTTVSGLPTGDKGSGDGRDMPGIDPRRDGQRAPNLAGDKSLGSGGRYDTLDLRITVYQGRGRSFHTFRDPHSPKDSANAKSDTFHTPLNSAMPVARNTNSVRHNTFITHHQTKLPFGSRSVAHRNAVGALVNAGKGGFHRGFRTRITDKLANSAVHGVESETADRAKDAKNLVRQGPAGSINRTDFGERNIHQGAQPSVPNAATINGTAAVHPRSSTGTVGGPVKIVSGTINGTGFRIRHP